MSTPQSPLRMAWLWWALGITALLLVTLASLLPVRGPDITHIDKLEHLLAWMLLGLGFGSLDAPRRRGWLLGLWLWSLALEGLQATLPWRLFSLADLLANSAGILLAAALLRTRAAQLVPLVDHKLFQRRQSPGF